MDEKRRGDVGGTFVLDEFHLRKYVRRMARVAGEEGKEEELMGYVERGERKRLREWSEEKGKGLSERDRKRLEKSLGYLERNWKGIRAREKGGGSDGKRHGGACQSCVVGEDELPPNGLERGGGVKAVEAKDPLEKRGRDRGSVSGAGEGGKEGRGGLPERGGADLVGKEKPKKEWEVRGGATSESKRSVKDENILPTDNRKDLQVEWEPQGRGKVRPSGSPSKVTLLKRIVDLAINILL